jgi:3-oxoacyl-[acyl-carrier protein] reductase
MGTLKGKKAFVTGAEQGIGKAIVEALAAEGCDVALHYFTDEQMAKDNAEAIKAQGCRSEIFHGDLTKEEDAVKTVKNAAEFLGGIDILVNNVGGLIARKHLEEVDNAFWNTVFNVNMTSMLYVTREALPFMKKNSEGTSIINLASLAGRKGGHPGSLVYSTFKGAVITWTRSLSNELAPYGIRVNCLAPGLILGTKFHSTHTTDESAKKTIAGIPLGRAGCPEDIARAVTFFASEYDGFITGTTLDINGGVYCA